MDLSTPVGQVVVRHPLAARVFHRFHIDFTFEGERTLRAHCAEQGLDPEEVVLAIQRELLSPEPEIRWDKVPVEDLVEYLVDRFHEPLKEELPRLQELAHRLVRTHGTKDRDRLEQLAETVDTLAHELLLHMEREETELFPAILEGRGAAFAGPMEAVERDHLLTGQILHWVRDLTHNYSLPTGISCATWRALWHGLEHLEVELKEHMHLENNVLHPRVRRRQPM